VADSQRIEDLRRRILKDPASIAFAQLAEEHRRAAQFEEAVRVARAGLAQHPAYLSARITLGRALLEMGRYDEAAAEFECVLRAAPDNLTAIRELADISQRRGAAASEADSEQRRGASASEADREQLRAAAASEADSAQLRGAAASEAESEQQEPLVSAADPVIAELEAWLAVLAEERDARPSRI
jgi:predicted Zn-dependent protease